MALNDCLQKQVAGCSAGLSKLSTRIGAATGVSCLRPSEEGSAVWKHLHKNQRLKSHLDEGNVDITSLRMRSNPARPFKNHYRTDLYEPLGAGGFGDVYQTVHIATGMKCAVKVLRKDRFEDFSLVLSELAVLLELDHPHVLKLYEYFEDEVAVYVVTELSCGGDLLGFVGDASKEPDYYDQVVRVFRQLMQAVAYCHSCGIAHRDLKMENCLFTDESRKNLKVIDFGLSALANASADQDTELVPLKMQGVLGTVAYMSPEMVRKETYGVTTDIWSAGILLHIVLTMGAHPFLPAKYMSDEERFSRILNSEFDASVMEKCGVPSEAQDLVMKMLCRDPANRLSAAEVLEHPWLHERRSPGASGTFKATLSNIPNFCKASKFEQALLTYIAHQACEKELEDLQKAFTMADSNGDGFLTKEEVQVAFEQGGVPMHEKDLDEIFENFGTRGRVPYTEFLAMTLKPDHIASDRAIKACFEFFDEDGNGKVSRSEITKVLDEDVANFVMDRWDASGDDHLDLEEFGDVIKQLAGLRRRHSSSDGSLSGASVVDVADPLSSRRPVLGRRLSRSRSKVLECLHLTPSNERKKNLRKQVSY
eukprot:TRINITY_DN55672_c0_g1_i1.p1 TRINITY_DN55672_c0_g1~~TRINITY_DN55672_c0_g1_i1.p1  ORF type:complete len:593 (-),score=135.62 TRINITY_DN55672_c0_g1_i1:126-1904(-)